MWVVILNAKKDSIPFYLKNGLSVRKKPTCP